MDHTGEGQAFVREEPPESRGVVIGNIAPPTTPGPLMVPYHAPAWPTVVGVCSMLFGLLGVLVGVIGVLSHEMFGWLGVFAPAASVEVFGGWVWARMGIGGVHAALAALLIWAAVDVLRRKRRTARLHTWWAVGKIVLALVSGGVGYFEQAAQVRAMQSDPTMASSAAASAAMMTSFAIVGLVIGLVVATAWPAFVLVWFRTRAAAKETRRWVP